MEENSNIHRVARKRKCIQNWKEERETGEEKLKDVKRVDVRKKKSLIVLHVAEKELNQHLETPRNKLLQEVNLIFYLLCTVSFSYLISFLFFSFFASYTRLSQTGNVYLENSNSCIHPHISTAQ